MRAHHRTFAFPTRTARNEVIRAKNQRVSKPRQRRQQHLLEVTVRRDIARVQRNRAVIIGFVCKALLLVGLCVGAWVGGKELLRRYLWENPDYFLSDIRQ